MAIFDSLKNNRSTSDPDNPQTQQRMDEMLNDELPSVNRRKGKGKFTEMLGLAAIVGAGLTVLYLINTGDEKKIEPKSKKAKILNTMPPLVMPAPPPPADSIVPSLQAAEIQKTGQMPIPIQQMDGKSGSINKPAGPVPPTWSDRKMSGGVVVSSQNNSANANTANPDIKSNMATVDVPDSSPLALKLKSTVSKGVSANLLPNRDYLITKGTALDCALETAIDSTVPGITTCRLTRDVYSDNGHVVLLDRGSQLVGEYQGGLTAGQARIFVLWTRAKTPNGVIVNLDSPGTDALGRSGHNGWVDRHFMERFGAAILLSLVKDGLAIARNNNSTSVTIGGGGSDQLATEVLKNTINIPPTLYINQGDHIQIMVSRDLDFSTVYGLELKE